jgi:two-component system, NarL family, nitrate/nitrite response regulator NarL
LLESVNQALPRLNGVPLAVITACMDHDAIRALVHKGIRCILPLDTRLDTLVPAFHMVLAGGEAIPSHVLLTHETPHPANGYSNGHGHSNGHGNGHGISPREQDVLNLLCLGKPNKIIAAELDMRESTVKVHLRSLMRKFGATNRVEVVLASNRMHHEAAPNHTKPKIQIPDDTEPEETTDPTPYPALPSLRSTISFPN